MDVRFGDSSGINGFDEMSGVPMIADFAASADEDRDSALAYEVPEEGADEGLSSGGGMMISCASGSSDASVSASIAEVIADGVPSDQGDFNGRGDGAARDARLDGGGVSSDGISGRLGEASGGGTR